MSNHDMLEGLQSHTRMPETIPHPTVLALTLAGIVSGLTGTLVFLCFPASIMWAVLSVLTIVFYAAMLIVRHRIEQKPKTLPVNDREQQESSAQSAAPVLPPDIPGALPADDPNDDSYTGNS